METEFNQAVEEWITYCRNSGALFDSSAKAIINCEAYNKILLMGHRALPLIRKLYDRDISDNFELEVIQGRGLLALVREIVGEDFQIPIEIRGNIHALEEYTKNWLDKNINKYS